MKRSQETVDGIKNAVKELLREKSDITTADIANMAHVNMAAINYHFIDKEHLINVVVNESISELKGDIYAILSNGFSNIEEGLRKFMDYLFEFSMENTGLIKLMLLSRENKEGSSFVSQFINDEKLTKIILNKIAEATGETDNEKTLCKYILLFSAFLLPLIGDFFSNSNLFGRNLKEKYIAELNKIMMG